MNCDESVQLLSARLDGELSADIAPALEEHLADCAACRELAADLERQDTALLEAFAIRRQIATRFADRVTETMSRELLPQPLRSTPSVRWWLYPAAAIAATVAIILWVNHLQSRTAHEVVNAPVSQPVPPVDLMPIAHLALSTGEIFTCPSPGKSWETLKAGEALKVGASVRTGESATCELAIEGGGTVRMNVNTEANFPDRRAVELSAGELWSAVPPTALPFQLRTRESSVQVIGVRTLPATVSPGESLTLQSLDANIFRCVPTTDAIEAASWFDGLLLQKPAHDPEVVRRVTELLARIATERLKQPDHLGPVERQVRARGGAWCNALATWTADNSRPVESRRVGVSLLAELAPQEMLPNLIRLQQDPDPLIRAAAEQGLARFAKVQVPLKKG